MTQATGRPPGTADEFLVHPRHLAGAGDISTVLQPLVYTHYWAQHRDLATGRVSATSGCGRIEVAAEQAVFHLWRVSVRRHRDDRAPLWTATFTQETPAEITAAFARALAEDRRTAPGEIVAEDTVSPTTAWRPLLKAGWTTSDLSAVQLDDGSGGSLIVHDGGPGGTVIDGIRVTSPDGTCSLVHSPLPDDAFDTGVGSWMIEAAFGPGWADQWTAILSADTPVRYLYKLTRALTDPAPVLRTRDQISDAIRAAARVRPAPARSRPRNPFAAAAHPYTADRSGPPALSPKELR